LVRLFKLDSPALLVLDCLDALLLVSNISASAMKAGLSLLALPILLELDVRVVVAFDLLLFASEAN